MLSAQFVALYKPHKPKLNLQHLALASNISLRHKLLAPLDKSG